MNSDKLLKYHKLIADGKSGDAALLMAIEFESGEWLAGESQKDDYFSKRELERKKKEGIGIALEYYVQARDACSGLNKLRALVGLFRCKHRDLLYDYPEIMPDAQLRRERALCDKLVERWSPNFRFRIQQVKECSGGAVQCLEALAADLGLEGTIPQSEIESMYELAVRNGSTVACLRLGNLKLRQGCDPDAERYYRLGVTRGSVGAERALGEFLIRRNNTIEGIEYLVRAASSGSGEAWFSIANFLIAGENSDEMRDDIANCYRFAVRCGYAAAYDWLAENDPIDPKDRYGFRSNRQKIVAEYNKRKYEAQIACCDADSCYAAYRYFLGLRTYNNSDILRKAIERAAFLGCPDAMFELARLLDSNVKKKDAYSGRLWRDVERRRDKDDIAAVGFYRRAAAMGHVEAMRVVGCLYRDGRIVVADRNMAHDWLLKAAVAGDAEAQLAVAAMFREGSGCAENPAEAALWYSKAFANDRLNECDAKLAAFGCWQLGQIMESSSEGHLKWENILPVYKRAAEEFKSPDAFWRLGELYESGICGDRSLDLAAKYYCNALFLRCERCHCRNQPQSLFDELLLKDRCHKDENAISEQTAYCVVLAYGYDVGFSVHDEGDSVILTPNAENARKWYGLAMKHGNATAAWRYGELCEFGLGGSTDLSSAEESYCMAAASGRLVMARHLAEKYRSGVIGGMRHFEQAVTWYQKCIDLGDRESAFALGKMYMSGIGVARSMAKAQELFAQSQCEDGYMAIAKICLSADDVHRDLDRALRCLGLCSSCEARILRGKLCFEQGRRFECGVGVEKDLLEAVRWYTKAAAAKCVEAQVRLSELYELGTNGLSRDLYKASRWCYWASENGDARCAFRFGVYCELNLVENDHGMSYVTQLYEKAKRGGCEEGNVRLAELKCPQTEVPLDVSREPCLPEIVSVDDVYSIVSDEHKMDNAIVSSALEKFANNEWSYRIKHSETLRRYVEDHDICELDIPKHRFSIVFNETRRKVEPYVEPPNEDYGNWDYDVPDWKEESGWNDVYGADVEASDIIEFRD